MGSEQSKLQGEEVKITFGEWNESVNGKLRETKHWEVRKLNLWHNKRATAVKDIAHIHFTQLISLNLCGNTIRSIEPLASINMPHLQSLFLNENNISCVQVIRKMLWGSLQQLSLSNNHWGSGKTLTQAYIPGVKKFIVYESFDKEKNQFCDPCFPAKAQPHSLQLLCIQVKNFCADRSAHACLQRRWPNIGIY